MGIDRTRGWKRDGMLASQKVLVYIFNHSLFERYILVVFCSIRVGGVGFLTIPDLHHSLA